MWLFCLEIGWLLSIKRQASDLNLSLLYNNFIDYLVKIKEIIILFFNLLVYVTGV